MAAKRLTSTAPMAYRLRWRPVASAVRAERARAVEVSVVGDVVAAADRVAVVAVAVADRSRLHKEGCALSVALFLHCAATRSQ
jgi:hypothetical protein